MSLEKLNPEAATQDYITGCPKFCFKTEIGLEMNSTLFCRNE